MTELNPKHDGLPREFVRPPNCSTELGRVGGPKCPNCNQNHLVPGYCQVLDPLSRKFKGTEAERAAEIEAMRRHWQSVLGGKVSVIGGDLSVTKADPLTLSERSGPVSESVSVTDSGAATCVQCGKGFKAERSTARFCSDKCRVQFNKLKKAKALLPAIEAVTAHLGLGVGREERANGRDDSRASGTGSDGDDWRGD